MSFFEHLAKLLARVTFSGLVGFFFCFGLYYYIEKELPSCDHLKDYHPPVMTRLFTSELQLFREFSKERRVFTPYEAMPPLLIKAFISAEDRHFFNHNGLDIWSVLRATLENTVKGAWGKKPIGASTITQQVAKNFVVGNERSIERKIKEAIVAVRLEDTLTKERILELYLNEIYLGSGAYGVAAAALTYFNKSLHDLSIAECAYLASLPKAPSAYNPQKDYAKAKARRDWVVGRLKEEGYITKDQMNEAINEKIDFKPYETAKIEGDFYAEQVRKDLLENFGEQAVYFEGLTVYSCIDTRLQKIADTALQEGLLAFDKANGYRGPVMRVELTEDDKEWPDCELFKWFNAESKPLGVKDWIQGIVLGIKRNAKKEEYAEIGLKNGEKVQLHLSGVQWARKALGEGNIGATISKVSDCIQEGDVILISQHLKDQKIVYHLQQIPEVTGGLVVMNPYNGHVLAMSGGFSFEFNQYNSATQARRQPGSAFKPFVYMAALESGYTADSIIDDSPLDIYLGRGQGYYSPKNYSGTSYGPSPLRVGIEQSRNQMTVRLAHQIGMGKVVQMAKRFNIYDSLAKELAMSLGAGETTLFRLTAAYAMIANGGKRIHPTLIQKVQDRSGKHLYNHPNGFLPVLQDTNPITNWQKSMDKESNRPTFWDNREEVVDERIATTMTDFLHGVVLRGTAKKLLSLEEALKIQIFAKTGTSNDCKDAWIMAYTQSDTQPGYVIGVFIGHPIPKSMGDSATGGKVALPILERFLKYAYASK